MTGTDGLAQPARGRAVAVIIIAVALTALDGTIVALALPSIARDLAITPSGSIWVISAYQLAALVSLLPCAAIGDRIGYRRVYLFGVAVYLVASLVCMNAASLPVLAAARAMQGVGAAGVMAVNGALLRLTYPHALFARGVAINSAVVAGSAAAGPAVAAGVLSLTNWPWLFAANIPLGLLVLAVGWRALPPNIGKPVGGKGFPVTDALLNAFTFALVFLGAQLLSQSLQSRGDSVLLAAGLLASGIGIGAFHLRRQWTREAPLFPLDLLRVPVFALSMCTSVASFSAQTLAYVALPFLLLEDWGRSAADAGLLMSAWPLAIMMVAPLVARMIGRRHSGLLGGFGLGTLSAGLILLALLPPHVGFGEIAWRMALCGIGFGFFQSPNNHTILTTAPRHRSGAAGGMLGTARLTGQMVGAVLAALLFGLAPPSQGGALMGLWAAALLSAMGSVLSSMRVRHATRTD